MPSDMAFMSSTSLPGSSCINYNKVQNRAPIRPLKKALELPQAGFRVSTNRKLFQMTTAAPETKRVDIPSDASTSSPEEQNALFCAPDFADAVSGEWFGYECFFSMKDGSPQCIEVRLRSPSPAPRIHAYLTSVYTGALRTRRVPSLGCRY